MEENYFDKKLKNILENPPQLSPNPNALEDMRQRLVATQKPKGKGMPMLLWLLPLAFLPFLFSTIFFYNKYENLTEELKQINLQITNNQSVENKVIKTTYQYDTIYRTIYKDVIIERKFEKTASGKLTNYEKPNGFLVKNHSNSNSINFSNSFFNNRKETPFGNLFQNYQTQIGLDFPIMEGKNVANHSTKNAQNLEGLQFSELLPFQIRQESDLANKLSKIEPILKNNKTKAIYYFIPKGLTLGGFYSPFGFSNALGGIAGNSFGIKANIQFPRNVEMQIGVEFLKMGYKTKDVTEFPNFPVVPPDNIGDILAELYADFSYLQIPIIFKYNFLTEKKWQPSFGIGLVAKMPFKQKFKYEYSNTTIDEYKLNNSFSDGTFSARNLRTTIGLNYQLLKKWQIGMEILYQHSFEKTPEEYFKLNYWSGNLSLKYGF